jgi:hypothetical protein
LSFEFWVPINYKKSKFNYEEIATIIIGKEKNSPNE